MANNGPFYDVGLHCGQITSQGFSKATTGTFQLVIGVKILGVPEGEGYLPHKTQYQRTVWMALTDKTVPFVTESLKTIGFEGRPSQLDPESPNHVSLVGRTVDLWCKHESGQDGVVREKWQISNGGKLKENEPLPAKELRELDAMFGRAKRSGPVPVSRNNETITDDDIPF